MRSEINAGTLTVYLVGDIDAQNADVVKEEIFEIINLKNFETLIFDAKELQYISSAGLRAILAVQKKVGKNFSVINLSNDVLEIFKMAGLQYVIEISGCKV